MPVPGPPPGGGSGSGGSSGSGGGTPPPPPPPPPCIPVHAGACLSRSELDAEARRRAKSYRDVASFRNQWGLERIEADSAYAHLELVHGNAAEPGAGVTIGFIDSGIHTAHPLLGGKSITEVFLAGATDEDGSRRSHGTAVASVAAAPRLPGFDNTAHGVAPGADIAMFAISLASGRGGRRNYGSSNYRSKCSSPGMPAGRPGSPGSSNGGPATGARWTS